MGGCFGVIVCTYMMYVCTYRCIDVFGLINKRRERKFIEGENEPGGVKRVSALEILE